MLSDIHTWSTYLLSILLRNHMWELHWSANDGRQRRQQWQWRRQSLNLYISQNSHFFSGQSRHASSSLIVLYLWLGARRPTTQWYNSGMVSWYYLGWPLCLHRGNSASENLQQETQWPKCCLHKTPYVVAPLREPGDVIARTPPYAQLPTNAPTRTIFFFVHE